MLQIACGVGSATLAAALAFSILASPVVAVTNEQLLFLEVCDLSQEPDFHALSSSTPKVVLSPDHTLQAWRAVDRAYYDKNFNGKPWFKVGTTSNQA